MKKSDQLNTFFLACEFKPNNRLFSVLSPFAYDIKPAFIYGSLGIIGYNPISYSIIDTEGEIPLMGYILTITEPDTVLLLDKIKGYYGEEFFNMHDKRIVEAFTEVDESQPAYAYQISDMALEKFMSIEQIEFGIFDKDEILIDLLEEIGESL